MDKKESPQEKWNSHLKCKNRTLINNLNKYKKLSTNNNHHKYIIIKRMIR
jgi:hypothetical protein